MAYQIKLAEFEGPFDLLLHLIKENEINIYDIPIAKITDEYLKYIEMMEMLDLDVAGEFIVMAATLIHIKSKMLLPKEEGVVEEEDPRLALVKQLLEYKRFKEVAEKMYYLEDKQRFIFTREISEDLKDEEEYVEATLFDLLKAFKGILQYLPKEEVVELAKEEVSVTQKINEILDKLEINNNIEFNSLFEKKSTKQELIAIFLALLELIRLRLIIVLQTKLFGEIRIFRTENSLENLASLNLEEVKVG